MKYLFLIFMISACASRPCREPQAATPATTTTLEQTSESKTTSTPRVFVAKSDGAKQCEGKGTSPESMESQLKGIKVYSRSNQSDGKMRTAVCGASAGKFNVYEIDVKDLSKAKTAGFTEWKTKN